MKKNKKFLKMRIIVAYVLAVALICQSGIMVNANELANESFTSRGNCSDIIEFLDEDGNVFAIFIPDENSSTTIQPKYAGSINCTIGYGNYAGSSRFQMTTSTRIQVNIDISPNSSSYIGLYDNNTGKYSFPVSSLSSTGWHGSIYPSYNGNFSIAFRNNTHTNTTYVGTFSL